MISLKISDSGRIPALLEEEGVLYDMDVQEEDSVQTRKVVVIYRINCFKLCHFCGDMGHVQRYFPNKKKGMGAVANTVQVHG